jgi:hypothetical protein
MSTILDYFGYYLSYSYQENALLEKWQQFMCDIANYKQVDFLLTQEKTLQHIKTTIIEKTQLRVFPK